MAHHLIFTSMERTLKGGSGYGIAAQTSGIPSVLSDELTKIAAYVEIYPGGDPNRRFNPINYFFYRFNSWYILGRLSSANNDYSGRSNYLGEFFALEQSELQDCGPVSLLLELPFLEAFQGEARQLPFCVIPRIGDKGPGICNQWANITGDPGWGGVLAEKFQTNQPTMVLYDKALQGRNSLALIAESLNFLSPGERWSITFSTHVEGFPKGNQMRLRMLQQGGKQTREFKGNSLCMDLTKKDWLPAGAGILVDAARTGIIHNPVKSTQFARPPGIPASPFVPRALGTDKDQESLDSASNGLEADRGMPPMPGQGKVTQEQKPQPYSSIPPAKRVEKYQEVWTSPLGQGREEESNLSSVRIPWWLYVVGAVGLLISFVGGIGTGTQINRSGLDEAVIAVTTKDTELKKYIEVNDKLKSEHKKLEVKNKDDMENRDAKIVSEKNENAKLGENFNKMKKFREFVLNRLTKSIKEGESYIIIIETAEAEYNKIYGVYKKYSGNEKEIEDLLSRSANIKALNGAREEINIKFEKNNNFETIFKYDKSLEKIYYAGFDYDKTAKKIVEDALKSMIETKNSKNKKRDIVKNDLKNDLKNDNSTVFENFYGNEKGDGKDYSFANKEWFKTDEEKLKMPNSDRSKEFTSRCAKYFLDKTKDNTLFSEIGSIDIERYKYLKENGGRVSAYIEIHKESEDLKNRTNDIKKFKQAMTEVFGHNK